MIKINEFDILEEIVAKAHRICNQLFLFEAIEMEEDEVRLFLEYDEKTSRTGSGD